MQKTLQTNTRDFYDNNFMLLSFCAAVVLIPFAIHKITIGMYLFALLLLVLIVITLLNAFTIWKYKLVIFPFPIWVSMIVSFLIYAMHIGVFVLFWCYPALLSMYFIQHISYARIMSSISLVSLSVAALIYFESHVVLRFFVTSSLVVIFCDVLITILNQYQLKLSELAIRDPLTNVYNRRFMDELLNEIIDDSNRKFSHHCVLLFDIDNFKSINDKFGHHTGDDVLKLMVDVINHRKRKSDTVFRIGGEEFALLLKNTALNDAKNIAEGIRKLIEQTEFTHQRTVTVSIGVAEWQQHEKLHVWLKRVDEALYEAKNKGRNQVCLA